MSLARLRRSFTGESTFQCDSFSHIFRCATNHFQSDTEQERAMKGAVEPVIAPVGHL